MIFLETVAVSLLGLFFLAYIGYAPTRLLLPERLGTARLLALPWTGYAAFVVTAQFCSVAGLNMSLTALLALALATSANLALARSKSASSLTLTASYIPPVAALTLLVWVLGVLPLWLYGYHTIIGENWDGEIYLAMGAYLGDYGATTLGTATPNPLLNIMLVPPYSGRTHGFSYLHAALSSMSGQSSLVTLGPLLALLHALVVPACFFFFHTVWNWSARTALLTAALIGLNPFGLWITYNTFGMQVPSLGLLPMACAATMLALTPTPAGDWSKRRVWLLVGYAALLAAALAVTYHPALTAWAPIVGAGGLGLLFTYRRDWLGIVGRGFVVVAVTLILSGVAQLYSLGGFLAQYSEQTSGLGLTKFTSPTDALGLSLSFRTLLAAGPGQPILSAIVGGYNGLIWLAGLVGAVLILAWSIATVRRRDWPLLATFLGGFVYLLLFLRPLDYVYGWFKAQSFVGFLLVGALTGGMLWLGKGLAGKSYPLRSASFFLRSLPIVTLLITLSLLLVQYATPLRYSREMIESEAMRAYIAPGESVLVSNSRLMPGRLFNGLLSYYLRDATLYGNFNTANSEWRQVRPSGVYTWTVLPARERPEPYGLDLAGHVWANPLLALYRAPDKLLAAHGPDWRGDYPTASSDQPLRLYAGHDDVTLDRTAQTTGKVEHRRLELGLALFTTATVGIEIIPLEGATTSQTLTLPPGNSPLTLPVTAPATVTLHPSPSLDSPLTLRWAALRVDGPTTTGAGPPLRDTLMLHIENHVQGSNASTHIRRVDTRPANRRADHVVLDIYRVGGQGGAADHYGYWTFALSGDGAGFTVPLAGGPGAPGPGSRFLPELSRQGQAAAGRYSASLTFYHGDRPLDTVTDIYYFDARQGQTGLEISGIVLRILPVLFY